MSAKRVAVVAAVAGVLVGGAVAGGVAAASSGGGDPSGSSSGSVGAVATAAVVRTDLSTVTQVGGSIGYDGSYSVVIPSGASASSVAQAQQQVSQAEQGLANDETMDSYSDIQDQDSLTNAENAVNSAEATLSADEAKEAQACAGRGASSPGCAQAAEKVSQDGAQVDQAKQGLASAQLNSDRDHSQQAAKIQSDETQIQSAQANLANLEATEAAAGGSYTFVPKVGAVISEDQPVYALNGVKVPLLYGALAAYRAFYVGMSDGADVGQLTHDLLALGFGAGLTQSDHYSAATAAAVERWQRAEGLAVTGQILLGQAVFEPGPIRVTTVTPVVGQSSGGGSSSGSGSTVLTATSTTPVVTIDLDVTQEYLVKPGDAVSVVLPDGVTTVGGVVETVGNVAVCPGGTGTGTGSNVADQSPCGSSGSGNSSTPTVTVTVSLDSVPPGATLDQAPVNVNITTDRADHVLAVPVTALLALAGGGFGVDVVTGGTSHLVGVTTGLYSSTLVQVSGPGLSVGTRVQVPAS